jgi:hypothetical protein
MRDGTPSGFSTMSTGVPSGRNGMSRSGTIARHDALVAVPAGHLVAHRQLLLAGDVDRTCLMMPASGRRRSPGRSSARGLSIVSSANFG